MDRLKEFSYSKVTAIIYGFFLLLAFTACIIYPDNWFLPLPIAVVFGPFIAIRLGFSEGILALIVSIGLAAPLLFKNNFLNIVLLFISIIIWLFIGYCSGRWLYA